MKDMFVNYDNNIDKKLEPPFFPHINEQKILECQDNIAIVYNVMGDEIGVQVKQNTAFNLYLYLQGYVEDGSIDDLVLNSMLYIKVFNPRHKLVLQKQLETAELYNSEANYLVVPFTEDDAKLLEKDSYKLSINLVWSFGSYELFGENDGLLIVR